MLKRFFRDRGSTLGVTPAIIFLLLFFIAPFVVLAYFSFVTIEQGNIIGGPSLQKYVDLLRTPFTYYIFGRTIYLSIIVTLTTVLLGFPVAYLHSKIRNTVLKSALLAVVSAPLLTSSLVLSFGWITILSKNGMVNNFLINLGLIDEPITILFTLKAVMIGLIQVHLPFMIVPLISTLQGLPRDLEDAAANLGATKWQTFWRVTIPQSIPAIAAGMSLVFVLTYTAFTVPTLMGGAAMQIVSVYIWNNVRMLTWDTAASVASLLLLTSLIIITAFNALVRKLTPWQHISN